MKERNVVALEKLLLELLKDDDCGEPIFVRSIAFDLTRRGVLVPSALTDEQIADLCDIPPDAAWSRRKDLEDLAKGEV